MNRCILLILLIVLIILYYINVCNAENFTINQESVDKKITLYIFLTKNCKFCKEYEINKHEKIVDELSSDYNIKKIYLDDNTKNLFVKYNINHVPKAIVEQNNKFIEVSNEIDSKTIKDATNILNTNNKELLIFLSKRCPYCITYLKNTHKKITDELSNIYNIKLIFSDDDKDDLFKKYKINYVPNAIILSNHKEYEIKGIINSDNILNADKEENIYNKSIHYEPIHDESIHDESIHDESIHDVNIHEETINKKKILVFLSKRCPHCISYDTNTHNKLVNELKDKYIFEKIYDDNDDKSKKASINALFNKYNVRYVPKLIILDKNDKKEVMGCY